MKRYKASYYHQDLKHLSREVDYISYPATVPARDPHRKPGTDTGATGAGVKNFYDATWGRKSDPEFTAPRPLTAEACLPEAPHDFPTYSHTLFVFPCTAFGNCGIAWNEIGLIGFQLPEAESKNVEQEFGGKRTPRR